MANRDASRPLITKTLSIHGQVSLLYCMAMKFVVPDDIHLMLPYQAAGYEPGCIALATLEPNHGLRVFYSVHDAAEFDIDLGDALAWLNEHFDDIPDDGYLLDLPFVRGDTDAPTTTFENEYVRPYF